MSASGHMHRSGHDQMPGDRAVGTAADNAPRLIITLRKDHGRHRFVCDRLVEQLRLLYKNSER